MLTTIWEKYSRNTVPVDKIGTVAHKVQAAFFCFLDFHVRFPPRWKSLHYDGKVFTAVET